MTSSTLSHRDDLVAADVPQPYLPVLLSTPNPMILNRSKSDSSLLARRSFVLLEQ